MLIRLQGAFYPSMTLFLGLGSLLVLWLGSRDVIRGHITLGEFVAFNGYLVMLSWPMIAFGWVTNILQRGFASWKRMLEVLEHAPAISDADVTPRPDARRARRRHRDPRPHVPVSGSRPAGARTASACASSRARRWRSWAAPARASRR